MKEATSKKTDLLSRNNLAKRERFWLNSYRDCQWSVPEVSGGTDLVSFTVDFVDGVILPGVDQLTWRAFAPSRAKLLEDIVSFTVVKWALLTCTR